MPPECPDDHYLNHVIEGIRTLVRLEPNIPNVWSHRKIEWDYRLYAQRIQHCERYERKGLLDPRIVTWAEEVAVKCIVQRGLIGEKAREAEQLKRIRIELGIARSAKQRRKRRRKRYTMPADLRALRGRIRPRRTITSVLMRNKDTPRSFPARAVLKRNYHGNGARVDLLWTEPLQAMPSRRCLSPRHRFG